MRSNNVSLRNRVSVLTVAGIGAGLAGLSALGISLYVNRPLSNPDRITEQAHELIPGSTMAIADLSFEGRDSPDILKRKIGTVNTPNGPCEVTIELGLQPGGSYQVLANIVDASRCEQTTGKTIPVMTADEPETFNYEQGICNFTPDVAKLTRQLKGSIKGFAEIEALETQPFVDCAGLTSAVRPAQIRLANGDTCQAWIRAQKSGLDLFKTLECPRAG